MRKTFAMAFLMLASPLAAAQQAPFCIVQSYGTNCFYYNANTCQQQAQASGGMCIQNPANQQQSQQSAQSNFMDSFQRGQAFGAQMRQQREAHAAEVRAREAQAAMYEAQAQQAKMAATTQPTVVGARVEYLCEDAEGYRWETRTPAVGCVVVAVEP